MENRYDKYKDSGIAWIGEIPEHWEVKRMKSIYNFGKGLNITKADLVDKGIPVISYGQIHSKLNIGTCIKDSLIRYVPKVYLENNNTSLVKKGDVIFADTSEDLEGCGNCIYIDRDMLLYAGYHTIIAKNISTSYNRYFSYLFQTDCWRSQIRRLVNGVKLFSIPQKLLASTDVITPSTQEQQSISTYLDQKCGKIDELITLQEEMITKLQSYKQSVITEAVTKGLNKNVPLKDSGIEWIGEIPKHWGSRRIKTFSLVKRGASPRPIDDPKYFDENGEFAWVRIADVSASGKYLECTTQKLSKLGSSLSVKRYPGDIFISIAGTVGKPIITNIKCCIHDGFVYFPNMKGISVEYLYYVFLSGQPYLGLGKMGTQLNLNTETIGNIYIPYPNIVEQTKIVYFLCQKCGEIDELISIKQQKIEKLKEYKKSLIFECVTGKRKVC